PPVPFPVRLRKTVTAPWSEAREEEPHHATLSAVGGVAARPRDGPCSWQWLAVPPLRRPHGGALLLLPAGTGRLGPWGPAGRTAGVRAAGRVVAGCVSAGCYQCPGDCPDECPDGGALAGAAVCRAGPARSAAGDQCPETEHPLLRSLFRTNAPRDAACL